LISLNGTRSFLQKNTFEFLSKTGKQMNERPLGLNQFLNFLLLT
jgi:hypothetical protein